MQTFLPYDSFVKSAQVLDWRRLGKQRVEAMQILKALETGKGWIHHPITKMWRGYENSLKVYMTVMIEEWIERGYNNTMKFPDILDTIEHPPWLGNEKFHASHRSNLLRKDFEYYSQFGWTENNSLPYLWLDENKNWYGLHTGTKNRIYL